MNSQSMSIVINEMRKENKEMRTENTLNFDILNRRGQEYNNNSKHKNDLNHSSNKIISDWQNLHRPDVNQSETPSKFGILDSTINYN